MTLTPEQIADGWIAHDGGPCPAALDSKPGVMFRDGQIIPPGDEPAKLWAEGRADWWQHMGTDPEDNIIAYKPETVDAG